MSDVETIVGDENFFETVPVAEPVYDIDTTVTADERDFSSRMRPVLVTGTLLAMGIAGRVALQGVPSVEPIIALAVAAGYYYNWRHGAVLGASGFFVTNFMIWGGQGPWTIAQVIGAGLAGVSGGVIGRVFDSKYAYVAALASGVLLYELVVNAASVAYTPWAITLGAAYVLAAVPYTVMHIVSTIGFGGIMYGMEGYLTRIYRGN